MGSKGQAMPPKSSNSPVSGAIPDRLFRTLAETSAIGIALYGRDRVLYANPAMEEITGYRVDELIAMGPLAQVHADDACAVARRLDERLRGERPAGERFEMRLMHRDGSERWIEVSSSRIDWDGEPAALASIFDVSERKRAERELRESRERLDLAQSAARYVTWEWNADTDELLVDGRVEAIYGVPLEEVGTHRRGVPAPAPPGRPRRPRRRHAPGARRRPGPPARRRGALPATRRRVRLARRARPPAAHRRQAAAGDRRRHRHQRAQARRDGAAGGEGARPGHPRLDRRRGHPHRRRGARSTT